MDDTRTSADHWNRMAAPVGATRWWLHPAIVAHVNRLIGGVAGTGVVDGDIALLRRLSPGGFRRAVSVGAGAGAKEIALVRSGLVDRVDIHEISEVRVAQGRRAAADAELADRIVFHNDMVDFAARIAVDLVYWNNALHHMPSAAEAIAWSRRALEGGGTFYMNDFVGPTRMQYPDAWLDAGSRLRAILPDRFFRWSDGRLGTIPRRVMRPDEQALVALDPSECADSGAILPALTRIFPAVAVRNTGGVLYHEGLNDILANFTGEDAPLLETILMLDEALAAQGMTHYAVAHATV
ncbi:class I SAM-dependent methyltransferase [Sphingomonas profundi]|uniref:class I SAM-dependent methyltransferase n=1 Tax=Alterirhizorhabdus profundi TaxID=2681549 RepID=UPI0012E81B21|nr:class I SAM-dependent methyltransferase [Sphingomonas profundi]